MTETEAIQAGATKIATTTAPVAAGTIVTSSTVMTSAATFTRTIDTATAPAAPTGSGSPLAGVWTWVNTTMSDGTVVAPQSDGSYGMRFLDSGRVDIFADCNRVVGRFTSRGGNLHLRLGGASDLYCGPDSQSSIFIQDLRSFSDVMLQGNDLFLTLETDSGTMHFTRQ